MYLIFIISVFNYSKALVKITAFINLSANPDTTSSTSLQLIPEGALNMVRTDSSDGNLPLIQSVKVTAISVEMILPRDLHSESNWNVSAR